MSGLQRSGNTLLASILNQNPDIYVSPSSSMMGLIGAAMGQLNSPQNIDYERSNDIVNVAHGIGDLYYASKDQQYIGDKNHWWCIQSNIDMLLMAGYKPKVICPVRDVLEVLASFNTLIEKDPGNKNNVIDQGTLAETFPNKPMADRRAEYLMQSKMDMPILLNGLKTALLPEYKDMFLFLEYNDIVDKTESVVQRIHDFVEIPDFHYSYTGLKHDMPRSSLTGINNLHKVRPEIKRVSVDPADIYLPETIQRYSNLEFWRQ